MAVGRRPRTGARDRRRDPGSRVGLRWRGSSLQGSRCDRLDEVELVTLVWHLTLAGQTPTSLAANAIAALLAHPEQLAALRDDPALRPRAVDELVRWCGPQLLTVPRYARRTSRSTAHRSGRATASPWRSRPPTVTRDPRVFADPDRLDITCTDTIPGHLGFAHGPHFSLSAPLARVQRRSRCPRC